MFRNNIRTALRSLWRNRQFSLINTLGLTLGIAVFLFIAEYVVAEWSVNRFHKNYNSIYRLNIQSKDGQVDNQVPPGVAPLLKERIAGIDNYVRIADGIGEGVVSLPGNGTVEKTFRESSIAYADGSFFDVFTFPLVDGQPSLKMPKTLALSQDMSLKLFGTDKAAGRTLLVSNQFGNTAYTVTAVYKNMPEQSDIRANVLLSLSTLESAANRDDNDWADPATLESGFTYLYLLLNKETDNKKTAAAITSRLKSLEHNDDVAGAVLQPLRHLHLAPSFNYPLPTYGSLVLVTVFAGVALLIILIAWINYINLSTAQALRRAKEIGVRKVLGASRLQLTGQYFTETFMITLVSSIAAVLLVLLLQPQFNAFAGKQLSLEVLNHGPFWSIGATFFISTSLLAGGYVALVLTSFNPVSAIQGKRETPRRSFSLRKSLVVFQFVISIIFIIATLVLYKQLRYMHTEQLGMNLNELLVVKGPTVSSEGQAERNVAFKNALGSLPFVKKYAASNNIPGGGYNFSTDGITRLNPQKKDAYQSYAMFIADQHFFDTYGISFAAGQPFSVEDAERSWNNIRKVIINEKAARALGFNKEEAVGQKIVWDKNQYEVTGMVRDYHHLSLRETIRPTIYLASVSFGYFTVQTDLHNMPAKLATLKKLYNQCFPGNPFEYFFADETFNQQYTSENKLGNVFIAAAFVAIFIACMGLFGLAAFAARQRIKEIGIRKVLGAGVGDIAGLLSKDFVKLVLIAIVIASPIAGYVMHRWLQDFAYRTTISWPVFLLAAAIALVIALGTISFQAIGAAISNPVKSLRSE